jgi:RNA polymerase sigma factor for flagellar operon FliA
VELDDLVAYGAIGLVEAATRFEEKGVPFAAFARRRIYGAIVDGIRTHHWFGRRADRRLRVDRVGHDWQVRLGAGARAQNDVRRNGRPMVCPPTETEEIRAQVSAALRGLPALERRLVDLCYYQEKTLTQAAREVGIGRPWASRLRARALASLGAGLQGCASHPYRPKVQETTDSPRADFGDVRTSS